MSLCGQIEHQQIQQKDLIVLINLNVFSVQIHMQKTLTRIFSIALTNRFPQFHRL